MRTFRRLLGGFVAKVKVKVKSLSRVWLFATPWTVAYQASPSMGFSRQGYWSGLLFPSPGDLPHPRIEPEFPVLQADALPSEPPRKPHSCDPTACQAPLSTVHVISRPRILEWIAIPFSRRSSRPRGQTQVSCIAGGFFTNWVTREVSLSVENGELQHEQII